MEVRVDPPARGEANMARDAAMLAAARPAARLYGWIPAAVSLGYGQDPSVVDPQAARELGVDVVRRPTGGGALLHDENEITYAIVVPRAWVPPDPWATYRRLSWGILEGLRRVGVPAEFFEGRGGQDALCYLRGEGISITARGRRISGGAQKRTRTAVLQHGTVLVTRDAMRTARLLGGEASAIARRTTSVEELAPELIRGEIVASIRSAFEDAWHEDGFKADAMEKAPA